MKWQKLDFMCVCCVVSDADCPEDLEPFALLSGENIEFMGRSEGNYLVISNYRFFATLEDGFYSVSLQIRAADGMLSILLYAWTVI